MHSPQQLVIGRRTVGFWKPNEIPRLDGWFTAREFANINLSWFADILASLCVKTIDDLGGYILGAHLAPSQETPLYYFAILIPAGKRALICCSVPHPSEKSW